MVSEVDLVADVAADLRVLLHDRDGVRGSGVRDRVGPALRAAVEPLPLDGDLTAHLQQKLLVATAALPRNRRIAFLYASGLRSDEAFVGERIAQAGVVLNRSPRQVQRYLAAAARDVAEALLVRSRTGSRLAPQDCVTLKIAAHVDLRLRCPVYTATRTVYVQGSLAERITDFVSLVGEPGRPEPEPEVEVLTGGRLGVVERVDVGAYRIEIDLPRPLPRGATHRYTTRITFPSLSSLRPMNLIQPVRPVELFELVVEFAAHRLPDRVIRLDSAPPRAAYEPLSASHPYQELVPTPVVRTRFEHLVTGLTYGLIWGDPAG